MSRNAPVRRLSDPRLSQHLLESLEVSSEVSDYSDTIPEPPQKTSTPSHAVRPSRSDLPELFSRIETLYNEILNERSRRHTNVEALAGSLFKQISTGQEKNANVTKQLHHLDATIEEQRKILKSQIDQDNKKLHSRFVTMYS